jgi:hypothetical protein
VSIGFVLPRTAAGALLAASLIVGCAGCSAASSAKSEPSAPATATPHFQTTWLPVRTYDTAAPTPQIVRWQGPNVTAGRAPMAEALQLTSGQPSTTINLLVVSAGAYPNGYWQSVASSPSWQHFTEAGMAVAVNPGRSGSSTMAMSEDRGYIIQLTTTGVSEEDILRIMQGIRWQ